MIVIAINKKKSLDMFKSRKKIENINDFLNYGKFLSKRKSPSGRTDTHTHTLTHRAAFPVFII